MTPDKRRTHRYGLFKANKTSTPAHRAAYALHHEVILHPSVKVCHTCDNPPCCNPAHLFAGRQKANIADAIKKGRFKNFPKPFGPGGSRGKSTASDEQVRAVRKDYDAAPKRQNGQLVKGVVIALAKKHNLKPRIVSWIGTRRFYRWVPD